MRVAIVVVLAGPLVRVPVVAQALRAQPEHKALLAAAELLLRDELQLEVCLREDTLGGEGAALQRPQRSGAVVEIAVQARGVRGRILVELRRYVQVHVDPGSRPALRPRSKLSTRSLHRSLCGSLCLTAYCGGATKVHAPRSIVVVRGALRERRGVVRPLDMLVLESIRQDGTRHGDLRGAAHRLAVGAVVVGVDVVQAQLLVLRQSGGEYG
jgi:hypothetical protein